MNREQSELPLTLPMQPLEDQASEFKKQPRFTLPRSQKSLHAAKGKTKKCKSSVHKLQSTSKTYPYAKAEEQSEPRTK